MARKGGGPPTDNSVVDLFLFFQLCFEYNQERVRSNTTIFFNQAQQASLKTIKITLRCKRHSKL